MLDAIERCRQTAMDVLKPTKKALQHGLELHENSLVCEAYGFTPRGPVHDQDTETACDTRSWENVFMHKLYLTYMEDKQLRQECLEAWKAAGVNCVFLNAGIESSVPAELIKRLAKFTLLIDLYPEIYTRVVWPEQVEEAFATGKIALGFTTCGVPVVHELALENESLYQLQVFYQLGVRMMHLTYNRRNLLGDGCAEANDGGLSAFGHDVIAEMNKTGIIIDLAHAGQRTTIEAANASNLPVCASHTATQAISSHYRAKSDEAIKAIVKTGGYVGICALPQFLQGTGDINALLDHVDYIATNFGVEHVAIATDNAHFCGEPFRWAPKIKIFKRFESFWRQEPNFTETKQMVDSLAWTNWPLFTVGLVQRGYSDQEIKKILSGNFLRVFRANTKKTASY